MIQFLKDMHAEASNVSSQRVWGTFSLVNTFIVGYVALFKGETLTNIGMFLGGMLGVILVGKGLQKFAEAKGE